VYWLFLLGLAFGIELIEPVQKPIHDGEIIYEANLTPVEELTLAFSPYQDGKAYDYAVVDVPEGWRKIDSPLYANPIQVTIIPSEFAKGEYLIPIHIYDEGGFDNLPNLTVYVKINIEQDFFNISYPSYIAGNIKQPVRFHVNISTRTPTVFVVEAESEYNTFKKEILVKDFHSQTIEFIYPVPDYYWINITVYPKYASSIVKEGKIKAHIKESFFDDLRSFSYGILLYYPTQLLSNGLISFFYSLLSIS